MLTTKGYDTEVGERAGTLSGGQRQRIAIARSIVSNPRILLLDEATSALDPQAEHIVQRALDEISTNRTTLIIAHKLATVQKADDIAVISNGTVVEQGSHESLLRADGHYARLVAAQDLGHEDDVTEPKENIPNFVRQASLYKTESLVTSQIPDSPSETMGYSLIRCIWIMLSEQKSLYLCQFISAIACFVAGATFPAQALLFSRLLNIFTLPKDEGQTQADFYALMFFVVALGNLLAYIVIGFNCNLIGQEVTHRYRLEMFQNILKQDMEFFDRPENTSGGLTSKIVSLPAQLQELISANILLIFIITISIVSSSILALAYGWKLGLVVVFGGLPPLLFAGYARIRLETTFEATMSEQFSESAGLASEAVLAIKTVASLNLESSILQRYSHLLGGIVQKSVRSLSWTLLLHAVSQSLEFLIMALGFWYGSQLVSKGEYTVTQFYVIFVGVLFAGQAASQLFGYTTSKSISRHL